MFLNHCSFESLLFIWSMAPHIYLVYNTSQCKLPPPPTQIWQHFKIAGLYKYLVLSQWPCFAQWLGPRFLRFEQAGIYIDWCTVHYGYYYYCLFWNWRFLKAFYCLQAHQLQQLVWLCVTLSVSWFQRQRNKRRARNSIENPRNAL